MFRLSFFFTPFGVMAIGGIFAIVGLVDSFAFNHIHHWLVAGSSLTLLGWLWLIEQSG